MERRSEGPMSEDVIARFKEGQRQGWKHFAPLEAMTTPPAAPLVKHANVRAGQDVLDVGCGTGVVAVTAARIGNVEIEFREGDVETLPCEDAAFDVVLSQFGHMFAPRPEIALAEMLRV